MAEVRLDVDLGHPPDRVWHALTRRELLDRWFLPGGCGSSVGAVYQLHPRHDARFTGPIDVEVIEAVPDQRLVMQWTGTGLHGEMTWALLPTGTGCRLSIVQTGFLGTPQAQRREQLREAYQEMFGQALRLVLATPGPVAEVIWPGRQTDTRRRFQSVAGRRWRRPSLDLARWIDPRGWPPRLRHAGGLGLVVVAIAAFSVLWHPQGRTGRMATPSPGVPGDPVQVGVLPPTTDPAAPVAAPAGPVADPSAASATGGAPAGTRPAGAGPAAPAATPGTGGPPAVAGDISKGPLPPSSTAPAGQLTATYQTLKTEGNGNYLSQMVLSASEGTTSGWSVVVTLPVGATVTKTGGAAGVQQGTTVRFTPDGNPQVPAGSTAVFTFTVHKPAGTARPLSCSVNGRPCTGW